MRNVSLMTSVSNKRPRPYKHHTPKAECFAQLSTKYQKKSTDFFMTDSQTGPYIHLLLLWSWRNSNLRCGTNVGGQFRATQIDLLFTSAKQRLDNHLFTLQFGRTETFSARRKLLQHRLGKSHKGHSSDPPWH